MLTITADYRDDNVASGYYHVFLDGNRLPESRDNSSSVTKAASNRAFELQSVWLPFCQYEHLSFHLHALLPWFPWEPNRRSLCPSPWGPAGTPLLPLTRPLTLLTLGRGAEDRRVCALMMCLPGLQHWPRWAPARQPGFSLPQHKPKRRTVGIFNALSCLRRCYYTPSP